MLLFKTLIYHWPYICAKINHKVMLYTVIPICNNVLICLQDFLGGDTTFLDLEESERIEVEPRTGEYFF